ncbi:MAG: hypothetical protein WD334_04780 [Chitinophagales bacterium]
MITKISTLSILAFITCITFVFGQGIDESNYSKRMHTVKDMNSSEIERFISLMEEAVKNDPDNIDYSYEIAFALYVDKKYESAIKVLEPLSRRTKTSDNVFQLLGICYNLNGERLKAIATLDKGLKIFPKSGTLHLERGYLELLSKNKEQALNTFTKGTRVSPKFPENYYWAAKLYCDSQDEAWGIIYGEIYMSLKQEGKRTDEISKLLFDTYKSEIQLNSGTPNLSFCKEEPSSGSSSTPFCKVYETTLLEAIGSEKNIDLNSLSTIRKNFLSSYIENGHDKTYPNVIFRYQDKVSKAGHMEAYNYWLLKEGDKAGFEKWNAANKDKWNAFLKWFDSNSIRAIM